MSRPLLAALLLGCLGLAIASKDVAVGAPSGIGALLFNVDGRVVGPASLRLAPLKILIDGGSYSAILSTLTGPRLTHDVPAGTHLVEVVCTEFFFPPIRVDISAKSKKIKAAYADEMRAAAQYPLLMEPIRRNGYFEVREELSLLGIARQPYFLVTVIMPLGLMLLMKFLGPEMKAAQAELAGGDGSAPVPQGPTSQDLLESMFSTASAPRLTSGRANR
eukprot:tig00000663_g2950.t1